MRQYQFRLPPWTLGGDTIEGAEMDSFFFFFFFFSTYFAIIPDVTLHIGCCRDDVLTEEKLRKQRFSNKYHDVLHHTAHALSRMLSYLDFRLDWRKTIHYTTSGLIFLKYLNREKISVFKNIRILVHGGDLKK